MPLLSRITLWLGGLGFLGFGLACVLAPIETLAAAGVHLDGALAAAEIRAVYGGLELALGALMIRADGRPEWRRYGLTLVLASYGGIGTARLLGMLLGNVATPFLCVALATEAGLALLATLALRGRTPQTS